MKRKRDHLCEILDINNIGSEKFIIINYSYLGPDHMTAYLSPASKVHLVNSSLGTLYPTVDEDAGDREVYFIFYCQATDVGPWELSLDLEVSVTSVFNPSFLLE